LRATTSHRRGFPCSDDFLFHACRRHYHGGTARGCRYLARRQRPSLKRRKVGFRNSLFEACSAFTRVPACMVAKSPKVTRYTRVLQRICYLLRRPGCFRPSDRLAGWDSHPLEIADFHGILVFRDFQEQISADARQERSEPVDGPAPGSSRNGFPPPHPLGVPSAASGSIKRCLAR